MSAAERPAKRDEARASAALSGQDGMCTRRERLSAGHLPRNRLGSFPPPADSLGFVILLARPEPDVSPGTVAETLNLCDGGHCPAANKASRLRPALQTPLGPLPLGVPSLVSFFWVLAIRCVCDGIVCPVTAWQWHHSEIDKP